MNFLLIVIIYINYVSLGLPDSLLGSAWPVIYPDFEIPLSYSGILSMIISGMTIVSSLASDKLTVWLGAPLLATISIGLTAIGLFGYTVYDNFWVLCIASIPTGLGAGAVDAAINNFVALHYSAAHMSWMHGCSGIGDTISPLIMGYFIGKNSNWKGGYRAIAFIQAVICVLQFLSIPLWKKEREIGDEETENEEVVPVPLTFKQALLLPGSIVILIAFFSYFGVEATTNLWAATYLTDYKKIPEDKAATYSSLFFFGLTAGRFVSGFLGKWLGDKGFIRCGIGISSVGILCLYLPVKIEIISLIGLTIIGIGCAPIYPSLLHSTPDNFGKQYSQSLIGIQMAAAYVGTTFLPPLFGLIAEYISPEYLPYYLIIFEILMIIMTERMNCLTSPKKDIKEPLLESEYDPTVQ